jgi:hypothetical protein
MIDNVVPARNESEWETIIRQDLAKVAKAVEGIIAAGQYLAQAKKQLEHGCFLPLVHRLGLHERTAQQLMRIAEHRVLTNPAYADKLPTSMRTLSELATIPARTLERAIKDGSISFDMERDHVENLKWNQLLRGLTRQRRSINAQRRAAKARAKAEQPPPHVETPPTALPEPLPDPGAVETECLEPLSWVQRAAPAKSRPTKRPPESELQAGTRKGSLCLQQYCIHHKTSGSSPPILKIVTRKRSI